MLHILLMILKIIGIVLLAILGILVALLLIILFVPVRYRVKGKKQEDDINGTAKVSWLFGLISVVVQYQEKSVVLKVRLFGINLLKFIEKIKCRKKSSPKIKKQKTIKQESKPVQKKTTEQSGDNLESKEDTKNTQKMVSSEKEDQPSKPKQTVSKTVSENSDISTLGKIKNTVLEIIKIPSRIVAVIRKFRLTIHNIYDTINHWREFLADDTTKAALTLVKGHIFRLFVHIRPKKIRGQIIYGFEDPCTTGQVLAGISAFYPLYYKSLSITPDFTKQVFEGYLDFKGRVYSFYLVKTLLVIFFDKNIQSIIHKFRNKEAS